MPEPIIIKGGSADQELVDAQAVSAPIQTEAAQAPVVTPATEDAANQSTSSTATSES